MHKLSTTSSKHFLQASSYNMETYVNRTLTVQANGWSIERATLCELHIQISLGWGGHTFFKYTVK